jgi:phage baseplate assembly protein W
VASNIEQFGRGIICPFQRDGKGDFANASGTRLLSSDIGELLGVLGPTPTKPGELPWRTEIGSRLHALRHRQMHSEMIRAMAEQMTAGPVRQWEPRVRPGPTQVSEAGETTMQIRFSYIPVGNRQEATVAHVFTVEE